ESRIRKKHWKRWGPYLSVPHCRSERYGPQRFQCFFRMRASSSRRSSLVWFRGTLGHPPAECFRLWSHFSWITTALTPERVPVPASPAGARLISCIGCRKPHFGSEFLTRRLLLARPLLMPG